MAITTFLTWFNNINLSLLNSLFVHCILNITLWHTIAMLVLDNGILISLYKYSQMSKFQIYHGKNKLHFDELMIMRSALF